MTGIKAYGTVSEDGILKITGRDKFDADLRSEFAGKNVVITKYKETPQYEIVEKTFKS